MMLHTNSNKGPFLNEEGNHEFVFRLCDDEKRAVQKNYQLEAV